MDVHGEHLPLLRLPPTAVTLLGDQPIFLADVVGGGRHRSGDLLTLQKLRENLPKECLAEWATSRERQVNEARRRRDLR